jgi:hypothetical protein
MFIQKSVLVNGKSLFAAATVAAALGLSVPASAVTELISNGGFETGDFTGWTVFDQPGSAGSFFIDDADGSTPFALPTVGPASGSFYAVSDQIFFTATALIQSFTVAGPASSVILSFDMFVNSFAGSIVDPAGLDILLDPGSITPIAPNQHARVDILSAAAGPLDTGAGVLGNFYLGVDPLGSNPNPYTSYSFDITSLVGAGGTFRLRFAEVNNSNNLNQGVDNVSILANQGQGGVVPEPVTGMLGLMGLASLGMAARRRHV